MKDFQKYKKTILEKHDKSFKGEIDSKIKSLCNAINKNKSCVTLSSCSGRICILKVVKNNNKKFSEWLFITHSIASPKNILEVINKYENKEILYFKQESAIIHIGFESLEIGEKFLRIAKLSGFNRCGFISTTKKVVLECILAMPINVPIYDKKILISKDYICYLVKEGNKKQKISWIAIKKLEEEFKKYF